jgi:hypothetical protein
VRFVRPLDACEAKSWGSMYASVSVMTREWIWSPRADGN